MPNSATGANNTAEVEQLTWKDLRALAAKMPDACEARKLLDLLGEKMPAECLKKCRFLKLSYTYGDRIVNNGKFILPSRFKENESSILMGFDARKVPLAFLLDHNVEIFYDVRPQRERGHYIPPRVPYEELQNSAGHTRPLRILQQGQLFGLFQLVDAWRGRKPVIEGYSLSAGEVSIYIGLPIKSKELREALYPLNDDLRWQPFQRHSLLIRELLLSDSWRCTIVLIPDSLCEEARKSPIAANLIYETHISQMSQDKDDMNESNYLRKLSLTDAERYHEQIAYLLGIVRGQIPAMVPWRRAQTGLPLQETVDLLADHCRKRPTNKSLDARYFPYIMVPKLLSPGEHGYFSCWWNVGPIAPSTEPFKQVKALFSILSDQKCIPKLFLAPAQDLFEPYIHSKRRKKNAKTQSQLKSIDSADFMQIAEPAKDLSNSSSSKSEEKPKVIPLTLWLGGFLNSGFVVKRPK